MDRQIEINTSWCTLHVHTNGELYTNFLDENKKHDYNDR